MDARIRWAAFAVALVSSVSLGADFSTKNFVVSAPEPQLAKQVAMAAEQFRRDLAIQWLGHELPDWTEKCPVTVRIDAQAGGQTSFGFVNESGQSMPVGWQMEVYGSPQRILDSVLPHEVTHTIFATHFGRPLPRWADEGACTTVEHESERSKNHELLLRFLTSNRGIPFNRMFVMKQYPHDIYPLYAQGYSLARFLIMQGGRKHFVEYVGAGMSSEQPGREPRAWDAATKKYYGFSDLSELQVRWVQWVKQGCPDVSKAKAGDLAATKSPNQVPQSRTPERPAATDVSQTHSVTGLASWYVHQANEDSHDAPMSPATTMENQTAPDPRQNYRPGSIREGQPIEVLATVSATNVSVNRLQPDSVYYARPEIYPGSSHETTIWR